MFFLISLPYVGILKVAGVRLPAHLMGCGSGRLWKGDRYFLCRHFAVPNDLGGCFSIFCIRFNQLCNVLKVLIKLCGCHLVHILTSFRKRFNLCLTFLIILRCATYIKTSFRTNIAQRSCIFYTLRNDSFCGIIKRLKGGWTMADRKAQWQNDYIAKTYDRINLTVPKGQKEVIKAHADKHDGGSVNAFINRAIANQMERDKAAE